LSSDPNATIRKQVVADLRAMRDETHVTRVDIQALATHIDRLAADWGADFGRELPAEADIVNSRLTRLEDQVRTLRGDQP
jgi:hypothetical protein